MAGFVPGVCLSYCIMWSCAPPRAWPVATIILKHGERVCVLIDGHARVETRETGGERTGLAGCVPWPPAGTDGQCAFRGQRSRLTSRQHHSDMAPHISLVSILKCNKLTHDRGAAAAAAAYSTIFPYQLGNTETLWVTSTDNYKKMCTT